MAGEVQSPRPQQDWYVPQEQILRFSSEQEIQILDASLADRLAQSQGIYQFPKQLRHAIEQVGDQNHISRFDVTRMLRERQHPDLVGEVRNQSQDRIRYYGCIHGGSPEFVTELEALANGPEEELPHVIILGGDIGGATQQRTIKQKQLFYDYLMNRAGPLLRSTPDISQDDLLNAPGDAPPADSPTIRDGALKLLRFAYEEMAEYPQERVEEEMALYQSDEAIYAYVKSLFEQKLNSGTWVGQLPAEIRQRYMDQYEAAAKSMAPAFLKLKERGVEILWIEGNEDLKSSLDTISHGLDRVFDTQAYLEGLGISCKRDIGGKTIGSKYMIWIPYTPAWKFQEIQPEIIETLEAEADAAKEAGFEVIVVGHMQVEWGRHNKEQVAPPGYNADVTNHAHDAIALFKPHQVWHNHQHWEMRERPDDPNAKFIHEGAMVSYMPLLNSGEYNTPKRERVKREGATIFGRNREPLHRAV
jgi:hypothetical protein